MLTPVPEMNRRQLLATLSVASVSAFALSACSSEGDAKPASAGSTTSAAASGVPAASAGTLTIDSAAWSYDADNDVYWQLGRTYVARPAAPDYETLAVYVPGAYLDATHNGDDTYTATVNRSGKVGDYTASTAPIVLPVNTPGYAAQKPPMSYGYDEAAAYLRAGFVYVAAGLRGRDSTTAEYVGNAPWGVTDLKAAVRYLRYNAAFLPGDLGSIFVFGHSGGGAQSAVAGASGDASLYAPYLDAIGAATTDPAGKTLSDAIAGVMAWCPITSLDYANAAYEWNMGQFATTGTRAAGTWTAAYSADLAKAFASYVNKLGLKSPTGKRLRLRRSADGTYLAGSYYDYLVSVIEDSLNNFLAGTTFPYTPSDTAMAGMGAGAPGGGTSAGAGGAPPGGAPSGGAMPGGGTPPAGAPGGGMPQGGFPSGMPTAFPSGLPSSRPQLDGARQRKATVAATPSGAASASAEGSSPTYPTVRSYIAHLNSETTWVRYDAGTNTAKVLSLAGFVRSQKPASKDVGAFDGIDRGETENVVLGSGADGLHFARVSRDVIAAQESGYAKLSGWSSDYGADSYTRDFTTTDTLGKDVLTRGNLYNPMYYLAPTYEGYQTSTRAKHWRIRTGIMQGDTANTVEINLALALRAAGESVDFATVWGQGHTMAERSGDATTNFVNWVKQSVIG